MNILYISPRVPYPPDQGDKAVIYNHLKFLSRAHKITLLSLFQDEKELDGIAHLSGYCHRVEVFKKRPNLSILNFIYAVFKTDPFTVIRYWSPKMLKRSKALIESGSFDIVHCAFYYTGQYAISKKITIPKTTATVLDTHNVEYFIYSRYARLAANPFVRLIAWLESLRIKRYESSMHKKFDRCIVFSELDRKNIIKLSGFSDVVVNPACIETSIIEDGRGFPLSAVALAKAETPPMAGQECPAYPNETVLFFGLLNTPANDDAIRFFYRMIYPLVKKEMPSIKFIIAGKHPSRYTVGLSRDPDVRLLGLVPNIGGLLEKTALVIAPLRLGGGTRVKILESWAAGKAVVSTSIGAEGVDCKDGGDIIIADSVYDFASAVIKLLKDDNMRKEIGQAAFKKVREYYNPERVIKNLEKIYKEAITNG